MCIAQLASYYTKPLSLALLLIFVTSCIQKQWYGKTDDLVGGMISETGWSCTTCGMCMEECSTIEHAHHYGYERYLVLSEGKPPLQASEVLKKLDNGNPWGFQQKDRRNGQMMSVLSPL